MGIPTTRLVQLWGLFVRPISSLIAACVALIVIGGCSTGEVGQPKPGLPATGTSDSTSMSKSTAPSPARPKEIELQGVDPCATLTADQQKQLKIDEAVSDPSDVVKSGKLAPACSYRTNGSPSYIYNVSLISDAGIDYWQGPSNLDVDPKDVAGFAALQVKLSGTSDFDCSVAVDVADGQQLFVQFLPIDDFGQDQMCQNARKGAELALATLQTLK